MTDTDTQTDGNSSNNKVEQVKTALIAGAHALHIRPIPVNEKLGSKICRLPLVSWVNGLSARYLVVQEICKHYGCSVGHIAQAIAQIHKERLAYVDTRNVDATQEKDVQDLLEEVVITRGDGGSANAKLDSAAKIYIRDLKCPKPAKTNNQGKPVQAPDWLVQGSEHVGEAEDTEDETPEDKSTEEMSDAEMEVATAPE